MFSIFSGTMYSPWLSLKMCFLRSMIFSVPLGFHCPMSPGMVKEGQNCSKTRDGTVKWSFLTCVVPSLSIYGLRSPLWIPKVPATANVCWVIVPNCCCLLWNSPGEHTCSFHTYLALLIRLVIFHLWHVNQLKVENSIWICFPFHENITLP